MKSSTMTSSAELPQSEESPDNRGTSLLTAMKLVAASALFYSAGTSFAQTYHHHEATATHSHVVNDLSSSPNYAYQFRSLDNTNREHRRLSASEGPPSYMEDLMEDLKARKKLMEETPPEEVKYWFEYTGPLQVRLQHLVEMNIK